MPSVEQSRISREDMQIFQEVGRSLKIAIESVYRDGIDSLPLIDMDDEGGFNGRFRDGAEEYDFVITPDGKISYVETQGRRDSWLAGFYLDSRFESVETTPAYRSGFLHQYIRSDRGNRTKRCQKGKPCGNSCVARGVKCQQQLSPQVQIQLKQSGIKWKKLSPYAKVLAALAIGSLVASVATAGILLYGSHLKEQTEKQHQQRYEEFERNRREAQRQWEEFTAKQREEEQRVKDEAFQEELRRKQEAYAEAGRAWEEVKRQQREQARQRAAQASGQQVTDWGSVLGVATNASAEEVKAAYRKAARENHPDLAQDPEEKKRREEKMKQINTAYEAAQKQYPRRDSVFWES